MTILFGRNRTSEDIDVICENIPYTKFKEVWDDVHDEFEFIITSDPEDAYQNYLDENIALRSANIGEVIPNIELKFPTTGMHKKAINERIDVSLNRKHLQISPLEQQIAYKLFMGSEKDIEDARFLFKLFEEHLNTSELLDYIRALEIPMKEARYYLGWKK